MIFGAGGHGKVVLDAAQASGITIDCFVDDYPPAPDILGIAVRQTIEVLQQSAGFQFIVAVGDNKRRATIFSDLRRRGASPIQVVHPHAVIASSARIGVGTVVFAGVVINPDACIGENVIVNTSASVDHDCVIEDHVHLCPGIHLAGGVTVGEGTMMGIGSVALPGVKIGKWCVVGAGAVVNEDLPDGVVAFGVPARVQPS